MLAIVTKRQSLRQVGFWTLLVGAVGGAVAVLSGLQAEEHISHGEAVHRVMETHEELGLITLGVFGVLALWRIVRERRMGAGERALGVVVSVAGVGILFATGVYGGKLIFEHAAGIPTTTLHEEMEERDEGHHHEAARSTTRRLETHPPQLRGPATSIRRAPRLTPTHRIRHRMSTDR